MKHSYQHALGWCPQPSRSGSISIAMRSRDEVGWELLHA
jgi:hypothetical protein